MVEARGEAFEAVPGERRGERGGSPRAVEPEWGNACYGQLMISANTGFTQELPTLLAVRHSEARLEQ